MNRLQSDILGTLLEDIKKAKPPYKYGSSERGEYCTTYQPGNKVKWKRVFTDQETMRYFTSEYNGIYFTLWECKINDVRTQVVLTAYIEGLHKTTISTEMLLEYSKLKELIVRIDEICELTFNKMVFDRLADLKKE